MLMVSRWAGTGGPRNGAEETWGGQFCQAILPAAGFSRLAARKRMRNLKPHTHPLSWQTKRLPREGPLSLRLAAMLQHLSFLESCEDFISLVAHALVRAASTLVSTPGGCISHRLRLRRSVGQDIAFVVMLRWSTLLDRAEKAGRRRNTPLNSSPPAKISSRLSSRHRWHSCRRLGRHLTAASARFLVAAPPLCGPAHSVRRHLFSQPCRQAPAGALRAQSFGQVSPNAVSGDAPGIHRAANTSAGRLTQTHLRWQSAPERTEDGLNRPHREA